MAKLELGGRGGSQHPRSLQMRCGLSFLLCLASRPPYSVANTTTLDPSENAGRKDGKSPGPALSEETP